MANKDKPTIKKLPSYRYLATTNQGIVVKGNIKAATEIDAERMLVDQGLRPVNVEPTPSMFSMEEALPSLFKIKIRDVIVFSRQLATLLRSGISLLPAMEILQDQVTAGRAFKKIMSSIVNDLRSGGSFSQSISKHPKAFSDIYCRTVAVGEQSGNMEMVLNRMADYYERQDATGKKIGKALTYPAMVLGLGIVVVIILMTVVMPKMLDMFTAMNVELPLPTRILIGTTNFMSSHKLHLLIAAAVMVVAVLWLTKQPKGRRILDRARLMAPLIGPPTLMSELARFSRTTSMLIEAGLKLQDIMEMIPHSCNNTVMRDAFTQVKDGLILGEGISQPMTRIDLFPPLLVQMVTVGEESNTLDFTLGVVADFYETTAEEKTSAMVSMIGPISTIGIALMVGFLAISIIMPMYSLTGAFG